ncbi:hypothetical protein FOMPIDRAFT_1055740 [Fomitopsis schrenkii]|uniref:Uncharacterized protein n=1 Tax=Fomitopsis schrenkii TaxID=2126942 RepID=S8DJJ1_FOMSC|nr:hypothetical protein FOMPIDRAFT_1055740 [Fomitopsis schrenkii]
MRTLKIDMYMNEDLMHGPPTPVHPDREFWTLNLGSIHDLLNQPLFDSLTDATITLWPEDSHGVRLTCDAVHTAEEMERRLRWILEPWDERGILTVEGYNEVTDEELEEWNTEEGDSSDGAGSEETRSSEDETVQW